MSGAPSGADLAAALLRRARWRGVAVEQLLAPIVGRDPLGWLRELASRRRPRAATVAAVQRVLAGEPDAPLTLPPAKGEGQGEAPAPPPPSAVPLPVPGRNLKIDLNLVGSAMSPAIRRGAEEVAPAPQADDKVWCGPCAARVPAWFGDGCIAAVCPLRPAGGA